MRILNVNILPIYSSKYNEYKIKKQFMQLDSGNYKATTES